FSEPDFYRFKHIASYSSGKGGKVSGPRHAPALNSLFLAGRQITNTRDPLLDPTSALLGVLLCRSPLCRSIRVAPPCGFVLSHNSGASAFCSFPIEKYPRPPLITPRSCLPAQI